MHMVALSGLCCIRCVQAAHESRRAMICVFVQGERHIRGSGTYQMSSLLNHDCMPNVARYDDFDGAQEDNAIVEFRAMHDIPAHAQITQSYFPISW